MARTLICEIVTPEAKVYSGEASLVVVPTEKGELGVLPLHAPLVSTLASGEVRIKFENDAEEPIRFAASGGYVQVFEDKVIVLADIAINAADIKVSVVKDRLEKLTERTGEVEKGSAEAEQLTFDINWCETQLMVARVE